MLEDMKKPNNTHTPYLNLSFWDAIARSNIETKEDLFLCVEFKQIQPIYIHCTVFSCIWRKKAIYVFNAILSKYFVTCIGLDFHRRRHSITSTHHEKWTRQKSIPCPHCEIRTPIKWKLSCCVGLVTCLSVGIISSPTLSLYTEKLTCQNLRIEIKYCVVLSWIKS